MIIETRDHLFSELFNSGSLVNNQMVETTDAPVTVDNHHCYSRVLEFTITREMYQDITNQEHNNSRLKQAKNMTISCEQNFLATIFSIFAYPKMIKEYGENVVFILYTVSCIYDNTHGDIQGRLKVRYAVKYPKPSEDAFYIDGFLKMFGDFNNDSSTGMIGYKQEVIDFLEDAEQRWKNHFPGQKTHRQYAKENRAEQLRKMMSYYNGGEYEG